MQITKREFLRQLGLVGVVGAAGSVFGDAYVATNEKLPPGSVGDPKRVNFGKFMFDLPHSIEDGESSSLKDGKVFFPGRQVPIFHQTDVVVVGGGPAGFAAAVAAAKTGAKVALVERYGSLGGLFTNGMVLIMLATARREENGSFTPVTRGVCGEFMDRAKALGHDFCTDRTDRNCHQPTVDPEAAKYLMDRMIEESGVEMFFHSWGVDVIQDGDTVRGVVFMSKQGMQAILARQVVDCTGDGDMYFAAGADYRQITAAIGFVSRLANMDRITAKKAPKGPDGKPLGGSWPLRGNEGNPSTCWTGVQNHGGNGLDVRTLSREEVYHRKTTWEWVSRMRGQPGWEKVFIANTASQIGPRVTRLLKSGCIVDQKMLESGSYDPKDCIGWFGMEGPQHAFPVPYRSLVPEGVENLLAAGRCIGAPDTCDHFRLICPCMVTGEAAGTAAALAVRQGTTPRSLDVSLLQKTLREHGQYLG